MGRSANAGLLFEWLGVVFLSVLLHEFGHALAARAFGLSPAIRLYAMGGLTSWQSQAAVTPLRHLIISLSGPAAGFLLGGTVLLIGPVFLGSDRSSVTTIAYFDLLWVNVGWGVFNLLPMLPLDGGTVLITLERWLLKREDQLVSHVISLLTALTIVVLALKARFAWIAFLGIWFAYTNGDALYRSLQTHFDRKLRPDLDQIREARERGETDLALELIRKVQSRARTSATKHEAAQLLILVYLNQGKYEEAELELRRFSALYGESAYLEGLLLFGKDPATALPYLRAVFAQTPDKQWGLMLNQSLIAAGDFGDVFELCEHPAMATVKFELLVNLQGRSFEVGDFATAVKAGLLAYEQKADPNLAYNLACALSRDSHPEAALEWVSRAIELGFSDEEMLLSDPDLAAARALPEFKRITARVQDQPRPS
jgi:Zn-dependent protease/thioredoxin-like negative regulator of GroEL